MRGSVHRFAQVMEMQLKANDHKPGWENDPIRGLYEHLKEEVDELKEALDNVDIEEALKECADVANMAMMVWDNLDRAIRSASAKPVPLYHEGDEVLVYGATNGIHGDVGVITAIVQEEPESHAIYHIDITVDGEKTGETTRVYKEQMRPVKTP